MNLRSLLFSSFLLWGTTLFLCTCSLAAQHPDNSKPNMEVLVAGKDGVSSPTCQYCPFPKYTREARKKKLQGTVLLSVVVTSEGKPTEIKIVNDLGEGLGQKAAEAVRKGRFFPAIKDGAPVTARVQIEVSFRLY